MNLDRLVVLFVIGQLPLLFLPNFALPYALLFTLGVMSYALFHQKGSWLIWGIFTLCNYAQIFQLVFQAEHFALQPPKTQRIEIVRLLKQTEYQTAVGKLSTGEQILLNWQTATPLALHQHYRTALKIRPIASRLNHGNFNRQKWLFANHLIGSATVKQAEIQSSSPLPLRTQWLEKVRMQTQHFPTQGLLLALAFGERAWLTDEDWQRFQHTATAHLIAISGLHIALAFGMGFWLAKRVQWLIIRFSFILRKRQAVWFSPFFAKAWGLIFALGYSYLAGFAIPTVRALWAIGLWLALQFARRHYTAWQLWWRVVALLMALDPLTLISDSFWLSILAVACLIFWYQHFPLSAFCKISSKPIRLLASLLHLQIGIGLLFMPVQCWFFEGVSLWALPANLLIVPLFSFLLVPVVLLSLLSFDVFHTWQLADWLAQISLGLLAPLSHHWQPLSQTAQWQLCTSAGLILWLIDGFLRHRFRLLLLLSSLLCAVCCALFSVRTKPQAQWIMFDVGQGLAMALVENQRAVVFDTGASWGKQADNTMAKLEILPYLQRHGLNVEAIFLSHDDNDHSGGIRALLQAYPQAQLISSSQQRYENHTPEPCLAGKKWQFGGWKLKALHPTHTPTRAHNTHSCTLIAEFGQTKILLTGDLDANQERQIAPLVGKIDFLQVPHHGSKTSTSETLLALTQPRVAMISVGRFNPWKMPHQSVSKRLANHHILQIDTATAGMIRVNIFTSHWEIDTARNSWSAWYEKIYPSRDK